MATQGPIADKKYVPTTPYATHGVFTTEIHSGHKTGQMVGAPSLMTTTYGSGRVLISPPHPEETQPQASAHVWLSDIAHAHYLCHAGVTTLAP